MIFHSFGFLFVFLPAALAAWWAAAAGKKAWSLPVLTAASLLFYSLWHWPHLGVLCASIAFNYAAGKRIHAGAGPWLLRCAVGANLALLAGFKYLPSLGYDILLPLGISFFTFTQIAFLLDARQGDISPLRPVHYALFVSFFPHCIAGPILHHKEMMDQFAAPDVTRPRKDHIASGLAYLTIGLAKKVMLADTLAPWANAAFSADGPAGMAGAWAGVLTYALQLYFDFSGYCDMANGLALLFNIRFPRNFDAPYQAASMIEFWQRWHITLSRFLRDYVLFQLPGNRRRIRHA
jgi:alginate O-acetyltransferase complex protein AlgI